MNLARRALLGLPIGRCLARRTRIISYTPALSSQGYQHSQTTPFTCSYPYCQRASPRDIVMEEEDVTSTNSQDNAQKRSADDTESGPEGKRLKTDEAPDNANKDVKPVGDTGGASTERVKRKKSALLLVYSGLGYYGMQRNPGFPTIEEDLLGALLKMKMITEDAFKSPGQIQFQRAARTDKGVSAAGQIVSLRLPVGSEKLSKEINEHLPKQIRVLDIKRTTKAFNSKNNCMARTYTYMTPTFAFTPVDQKVKEDFRMSEEIQAEMSRLLMHYKGTHKFHNFTSQKKPTDPSAARYIINIQCGEPFIEDGIEFCVISIKGQSFMIHQIRKMIGLVMAIMRGFASTSHMDKAWGNKRVDIPKAPGLGLMLERLHYDAYNKKFGNDGMHEKLEWSDYEDQIQQFKKEFIYSTIIQTEKKEKSMLSWLSTLHLHKYDTYEDWDTSLPREPSPLAQAHLNLQAHRETKELEENSKPEPEESSGKQEEMLSSDKQSHQGDESVSSTS